MTHDIAVLVRVEIFDGQVLHAVKQFAPQFAKEALRNIGHELCVQGDKDDGQHVQRNQDAHERQYALFGYCPGQGAGLQAIRDHFQHLLCKYRGDSGHAR